MSNYYTITPQQDANGLQQPESSVNQKIQVNSGISSNWQYRQYMQNNANQIMKYNTMQSIYSSGNNPYTSANTQPTNKTPYLYSSTNTSNPTYGFRNSDLKQDYMTRENLQSRLVSPTIPTNL